MKVAYDLRRIANVGIGRYMETLVEAVVALAPEHEYTLLMPEGSRHLEHLPPGIRRLHLHSKYYSLSEQYEIPRLLRSHGIDLLHAPHFVVPLFKTCTTVATIHDVIHLVYPQDINSRIGSIYAGWMMKQALRIADRIITVSEFSRQDIIRRAGGDPDKIRVIYPMLAPRISSASNPSRDADRESVWQRYGIRKNFILYMGIFRERKNHLGLLRAFALLLQRGFDLQLVISGPKGPLQEKIAEAARQLRIFDHLVFTGFVAEPDMAALYGSASIYACPSLYEGFGFTPLEAMACGVPAVCHNGTSLPEVCGDAAVLSDATNAEEFANALERVLVDSELRADLIEKGYRNIRRFTGNDSAVSVLRLYSDLLAG